MCSWFVSSAQHSIVAHHLVSWPCSTGQGAQVHPSVVQQDRTDENQPWQRHRISSLQSMMKVMPNGETFASAPCSGQNMDVLLMDVQPSPSWIGSVFCDYGTVVSELVTGFRDTLHSAFSDQELLLVFVPFVVIQSHSSSPKSDCQDLGCAITPRSCSWRHTGTVGQDKTKVWIFHNSACLAAWVDAEFHYLQIAADLFKGAFPCW